MSTLQMIFYHTNHILKGRGIKTYVILLLVSLITNMYPEWGQLWMDIHETPYVVFALISSIINIIIMYILYFMFLKILRKEPFTLADVRYGFSKSGVFIICGLLLSVMQTVFIYACSFLGGYTFLFLLLYAIIFAYFMVWNACIAYGVYDGVNFIQLLSGGLYIMKEHIGEVFMVTLPVIIWYMIGHYFIPDISYAILENPYYAWQFSASIIQGIALGPVQALQLVVVYLGYFMILYALMLPVFTYMAKLYEEERFICMPSAKRLPHTEES